MPLSVWANDSQIATHGYDLEAAYEFATPYIPTLLVTPIVLKPSQLPEDVRTRASFMKKFKVRDDLALRDQFVYADACDKMTAYFF